MLCVLLSSTAAAVAIKGSTGTGPAPPERRGYQTISFHGIFSLVRSDSVKEPKVHA